MSDASLSAPRIETWVREALEYRLSQLHVCLPGQIVEYNANTQRADVQPSLRYKHITPAGVTLDEEYPVLPEVPVVDQRGGDAFIHIPIKVGDFVMLVFCESAIDIWLDSTGDVASPFVTRHHDLTDAIALPVNLYPSSSKLNALNNDNLSLGFETGAQVHMKPSGIISLGSESEMFSAAVAEIVDAQLTALKTTLSTWSTTFAAASVDPGTTMAAVVGLGTALTALFASWPQSTASTVVKLDP